jgi:hypothetical protein
MNTILATLVVLAPPNPIIDYGAQTINPSSVGELRTIGWSGDEQYWSWDTELNGGGAMSAAERTVITARVSEPKAYWRWDEGSPDPQQSWFDAVSADTFSSLGILGNAPGHLIYQYQPSFFSANHHLKPLSQLKTQYSFVLQGETHLVKLEQQWESAWTTASPSPGQARYHRAKVIVRVDGNPIGFTEYSDAAAYSINKIYLSPGRDSISVSLARFTLVWFEGLNLMAEHQAFAGRYR